METMTDDLMKHFYRQEDSKQLHEWYEQSTRCKPDEKRLVPCFDLDILQYISPTKEMEIIAEILFERQVLGMPDE